MLQNWPSSGRGMREWDRVGSVQRGGTAVDTLLNDIVRSNGSASPEMCHVTRHPESLH